MISIVSALKYTQRTPSVIPHVATSCNPLFQTIFSSLDYVLLLSLVLIWHTSAFVIALLLYWLCDAQNYY